MMYGIGTDICDIRRIRASLERHGDRFAARVLSERELATWRTRSARWPEVTTDIAVGQMRQLEFVADAPGDWALHCHKSHHTMNAMGHDVPTMIGVDLF